MSEDDKKHSADYFGEYRDHWWNLDFLRLLTRHWAIDADARVLDVGAGVGHWTAVLYEVLPSGVSFTGVDTEPAWVAQAGDRLPGSRFAFREGDAEALPFADDEFDVVTCQTVLIHLATPAPAIEEMIRVLRPGGLLLAVEPSNRAGFFAYDSSTAALGVDDQLRRARFYLLCEEGKRHLGEGDSSLGDLLPGELARAGLHDVTVRLSDKAVPLVPPYSSPEQRAMARQSEQWFDQEVWVWDRPTTERYFRAGGGSPERFVAEWSFARSLQQAERDAIVAGHFTTAGGAIMYLVWGRKP